MEAEGAAEALSAVSPDWISALFTAN